MIESLLVSQPAYIWCWRYLYGLQVYREIAEEPHPKPWNYDPGFEYDPQVFYDVFAALRNHNQYKQNGLMRRVR